MGSQSNLDIVLATTSWTTSPGAIVLLVNVPRPLFRPALTSKKGWILYKSLVYSQSMYLRTLLRKLLAIVFAKLCPTVEFVFSRDTTWFIKDKLFVDCCCQYSQSFPPMAATHLGSPTAAWANVATSGKQRNPGNHLLSIVEEGGPPGWPRVSLSFAISATTIPRSREAGMQSE